MASSLVVRVAARWEETVAAGSEVVRAAARSAVSGEDTVSAGSRVARAAARAAGSELARAAVRGGGSGNVSGGSGSGTVVSGGSSPYYRWARPSQLAAQAAVLKERCALRTRGGGARAIMETEATAGTTAAVTAEATAGTASVVTAEVLAVAGGKGVALSGGAEATAMERGVEMVEAEIVEAAASAVVVEGSGMQIETAASAVVVEGNGMQIETAAASAVMIRSQMQIKIQSPAATVIARRETRLATSGFDFELLDEEDDDEFEPSDEDDDNSEPLLKDTRKHKRVRNGPIGNRTSDGKVVRQGANLVFGKLGSTASQLAILSERESSLTEKGKYRAAATIAAEAPVGAVDVGTMPRRETFPEGVAGATLHEAAQAHWRDSNMGKELKQRRTAAAYEKRVGLFNDWATQARYDSFCAWVEVSPGRFELHLIMDDGVPRAPTVASLLEFAFRQAAGDIDKGGRPEYRNGPQYRRVFGKPQGTSQMPEAKRKKHGFGPYSNESMRFTTIEQYLTSIRQWLTEKLKHYPEVANPAMNGFVRDCTKMLERAMGRSRVESHLPATMSVEFVKEVVTRADPKSMEEMQMVLYLVKNLIHGTRAHDESLLDWSDSHDLTELVASGHHGITLKYISTKNNKEQADRQKALSCVLGCAGALQFTEDGRINSAALCPAHLFKHLKELIATEMGLAIDDVEGPIFGKYKRICDVPSGSTLRASDHSSVAKEQAKALVCIVTQRRMR